MAKPISPANAFIYEDDIFKKTTKMAKDFGVSVQVENKPTALQAQKLKMVQNLFAFKVESGKDDFLSMWWQKTGPTKLSLWQNT